MTPIYSREPAKRAEALESECQRLRDKCDLFESEYNTLDAYCSRLESRLERQHKLTHALMVAALVGCVTLIILEVFFR